MSTTVDVPSLPNIGNDVFNRNENHSSGLISDAKLKEKDVESGTSLSEETDDGEVLSDARDLVTHVISVEDDPTLNPWTFRVLVIGLGLSAFGGVLG